MRHPARRGRLRALGRAGAAGRVRPDPGPRPARGDPRRGHRADGPGHRGAGAAGHRTAAARTGSASSSRTGSPRCAAATRWSCWPTARWSRPGRCASRAASPELLASSDAGRAGRLAGRRRRRRPRRRRVAATADRRPAPVGAGAPTALDADVAARRPTRRRCRRPPPRPDDAGDLPAGHQRPPVRAGRGRRCSWCWWLLGLDGAVLPLAVGRPGRRRRQPALAGRRHRRRRCWSPCRLPYYTGVWFPEWWVRQMLRISLRLVHGQTGPRRVSAHTPAEVVAQGGDTERVVHARRQPDRPVHLRCRPGRR